MLRRYVLKRAALRRVLLCCSMPRCIVSRRADLERALQENKRSARAWMLLGDLEAKTGADAAAIAAWRRLEEVNPAYLPIVAERLTQAPVASFVLKPGKEPPCNPGDKLWR